MGKKRKNKKSKDKFRWEASSRAPQSPRRPRTCEPNGEEEFFEGTSRQRHLLLSKGWRGEQTLSGEPQQPRPPRAPSMPILRQRPGAQVVALTHLGEVGRPCHYPPGQVSIKCVTTQRRKGDGRGRGLKTASVNNMVVPNNAPFAPKFENDKRAKQMIPPDPQSIRPPNLKMHEAP